MTGYCPAHECIEPFTALGAADVHREEQRFYDLCGAMVTLVRFECGKSSRVVTAL